MAYTPVQISDTLGVNLTGNEAPSAGGDNQAVPRVNPLSAVILSGNRIAIYVQTKASMNPGTTVSLDTSSADGGGTVTATTGTGQYISLNATAAASGDWIWAYGIAAIA